jgi:periplasmic protein TonB
MKIVINDPQKLDEIVFAKRNKSYGAYVLRAGYNNAIFKSLTIVSSTVCLFAVGALVYSKLSKVTETPYVGTNDSIRIVQFDNQPKEKEQKKPEPQKKAYVAPKADPAATVISDSAQAKPTPINDQIVNNGTANGDPNATAGTATTGATGDPVASTTPTAPPEPATAFPDQDPEFEGGLKALREFIANNVVYPNLARETGTEGTVHVSFVIDENGVVESSKVLKGIGYGCDEESVRVISKIPKFKKPGKNKFGIPVKTIFNIPIAFRLRN